MFGTLVRNICSSIHMKGHFIMEPCTYFIIAAILFIISFGATAPIASAASLAIAAIMLAGGLYTKFVLR